MLVGSITAIRLASFGLVCMLAAGVGLIRRDRRRVGWALVGISVAAVMALAAVGSYGSALFMGGATLFSTGIITDTRGHRVVALLGLTAGVFLLIIAALYAE